MSKLNPNLNSSNQNKNAYASRKIHNVQNNNIPLSYNEKITKSMRQTQNHNQNNFIIFGEGGVDKTFVPSSQLNKNPNQYLVNNPNSNYINMSKSSNANFKYIKQSFKYRQESDKKNSTVYIPNQMNQITESNNKNNSKYNNQKVNHIPTSKIANMKNPFFQNGTSTMAPKNNKINQEKKIKPSFNEKNKQIVQNNDDINNNMQNKGNNVSYQNAQNNNITNNNLPNKYSNVPNQISQNNNNMLNKISNAPNQIAQNNNNILNNGNNVENQIALNPFNNMNNNQINHNDINNKIQLQQNPPENQQNVILKGQNKKDKEQNNFSRYTKAALTGLKNLGNTSYLNSVLQLICNVKSFASHFLNPKNGEFYKNNVNKYLLSYVIHRLNTHIYPYPETNIKEIYKPDSVLQILGNYNLVYGDYKEKNPNELIVFILDKLHEELNTQKNKKVNEIQNDNIISDKSAVVNLGINNFMSNNNSIITTCFTWFELKETMCRTCNKYFYSFHNFPTFELNLIDCAKAQKIQDIKIENCLDFYSTLKIKNSFCKNCNNYNQISILNTIYSSPNYFIFLLDLKEENNIKFILEQNINLNKFIENKNVPLNFELNGIVFFDKKKKRYNTLCVSPVDQNWYLYDDEIVLPYDLNNFIIMFNNDVNKIYQPYILLYKGK